jgi:hypothetical protein
MNTETPPTAAELLAEWKRHKINAKLASDEEREKFGLIPILPQIEAIAVQLDQVCEDAGVEIYEGQFVYNTTEVWKTDARSKENDFMAIAANGSISAREQQALQEWLLIKNENGK